MEEDNIHEHFHNHEHGKVSKNKIILNILGVMLFILAIFFEKIFDFSKQMYLTFYIISYVLIGYEIILNALRSLFKKDMFDENFLMTIATLGAFFINEYTESIAVLLFYKVGEFLQDLAVEKSRKKIASALDLRSEYANLKSGSNTIKVKPEEVKMDEVIVIKNGEKIPLDGIIISGSTSINTAAITGESLPKEVFKGDEVLSGCINIGGVIEVKVTNTYEMSTAYKIIELIENASSKKSKTENFVTKFAKVYTPIVTFVAIFIAVLFPVILNINFSESLRRALSFLVVSCPCALVISIPLGFFVGIGTCGKKGILVKGSNYIDLLSNVKKMVFDKTGTLTKGKFEIVEKNFVESDITNDKIIEYVTICESYSNHYIAKSIVDNYKKEIDLSKVSSHEELSGMGIKAVIDSKTILVGNEKLLNKFNINFESIKSNKTILYISIDSKYIGYITLADTLKEESKNVINNLKKFGINETILLTGDEEKLADEIANKLDIDVVYSELLPQEKLEMFEKIKSTSRKTDIIAYVGDGINDGPVIAQADVGIAMGKGADIAIETADVVLMNDEIEKILDSIKISQRTKSIVKQNILVVLIVKVVFLVLSGFGISTMWEAVFADVGISLIAILNSFRIAK